MKWITAIAQRRFPIRWAWSDSKGRFVYLTKAEDRQDRIYNIRACVEDAVKYGLWSDAMFKEYTATHRLTRRPSNPRGRDVLSDFEIAYWNHSGSPAPHDLI